MKNKSKTIFCDLDGTLVKHPGSSAVITNPDYKLELLPGTRKFLQEIDVNGWYLILTTGRKRSMRESTIKQLENAGIYYDELIMGFGGAIRILINDRKVESDQDTAFAINLNRNEGVKNVKL